MENGFVFFFSLINAGLFILGLSYSRDFWELGGISKPLKFKKDV